MFDGIDLRNVGYLSVFMVATLDNWVRAKVTLYRCSYKKVF